MTGYYLTIGFHDGDFEVEVLVEENIENEQAEARGNSSFYHRAHLHDTKIVINENFTIYKDDLEKYQFRVCRVKKSIVSLSDYEPLTWEEALEYLSSEGIQLPFSLESYYYGVNKMGLNPFEIRDMES
ncbi:MULTISPECIES: hypothetical protein [Paenibacillus]|uniref:hypothetical protein n=1 Tax=Paenibacillus TaxID=44249 RepID=UPI0009A5BAD3|nr:MULTISPECIES: hypothetical protein [Paenibacillus]MCZ1269055.1 hypothetical protein [Paenibacillus tundrae]SLK16375.1 hypothetical protein SAMN06272722_110149 [Paenibacillus sp. RU5A]SOC74354.1 hypothetical protein SAMN05880581_110149 [Paenibacillus sp. RU26A]SOC76475.1 hypothetical protein SAMN05880586_110149 [Paenibacillus sp. RU5M]